MRSLLIAALILLSPASAPAQDGSQSPRQEKGQEIVVEGRSQAEQVREFIGALTRVPPGSQIRQYAWGVCPISRGLSDSQNAAVVRRMRQIARESRVPLAKGRCTPNVIVIASPDKDLLLKAFRNRYPALFDRMPAREREQVKRPSGPVIAWQVEDLVGATGNSLTGRIGESNPRLEEVVPASLVASHKRTVLVASFVLVDLEALHGLSTAQLADYAAMRAFARTEPERAAQADTPTILTLFDDRTAGRAPARELTRWDANFLKALYSTNNGDGVGSGAAYQRDAIAQRFRKSLEREEQAAKR